MLSSGYMVWISERERVDFYLKPLFGLCRQLTWIDKGLGIDPCELDLF